jgi:hypothetical protein
MNKNIVLDLYIFNQSNQLLVNSSSASTAFNSNSLRPIIVYAQKGKHPIEQIKEYIAAKNLKLASINFLPSLILNKFDTEMDEDYLVLSFKVIIETKDFVWIEDEMNKSAIWTDLESFSTDSKLLPEFHDKLFLDILNGKEIHYSGVYKESDGSNDVIQKSVHNLTN